MMRRGYTGSLLVLGVLTMAYLMRQFLFKGLVRVIMVVGKGCECRHGDC